MLLKNLVQGIYEMDRIERFLDLNVRKVTSDSREVCEGTLFVARQGTKHKGEDYISQAIEKGARVFVVDKNSAAKNSFKEYCVLKVEDPQEFLGQLLNKFYSDVLKDIRLLGVTGTNGKTTVTYLLESIFKAAGKGCGRIGTVEYRYGEQTISAKNTTPSPEVIFDLLSQMVGAKCAYCALEVSSHALDQRRVCGLDFKDAIFTNLTSDHMDYHQNQEDYFTAKSKLFTELNSSANALINTDDSFGKRLQGLTKGKCFTYGMNSESDFMAQEIQLNLDGAKFVMKCPDLSFEVQTSLVARHNVYNILSAAACAYREGVGVKDIQCGIKNLKIVPGRLERIDCGQDFYVFCDYAHTEDALSNVLHNIKSLSRSKVILVFGCGGDRDRTKRAPMGQVANHLADFSILTNDNPRTEDPLQIIDEIKCSFKNQQFEVVLDRRQAIERAFDLAKRDDVVVVAGKGHEDYQIFKDQTIDFNEREIIRELLLSKIKSP